MKKPIIIIISCCLLSSCQQISDSITQTFHPDGSSSNKEIVNNTHEHPDSDSSLQSSSHTVTITSETHTTTHSEQHLQDQEANFLDDSNKLIRAETALKNLPQFAGKEIFIYSTTYFNNDGSIYATLQNPENPKYIDQYEYRNDTWSAPKPVQLSVKDNIPSRLVSLNKIHFATAAKIARIYNEKAANIEGAKPLSAVYISIWDNTIRWFPTTINGSRERYSIQFNTDGTLKTFKQE